ncbi:MAG: hypothetical protein H6559_33130 [Lewinellaceae bacterium]|nr:hypothetical protein [Lewinellaceae bacterium]
MVVQSGGAARLALTTYRISDTTFQNAVVVAVHLKDFEFAHWFIGRYEPFLPESEKEFAVHFATAHCCFIRANFLKPWKTCEASTLPTPERFDENGFSNKVPFRVVASGGCLHGCL